MVWNISSYPQLIKNFKRRSIVGVHLDYLCKNRNSLNFALFSILLSLGYNTVGHTFYTLYNLAMYFWPVVKDEYNLRHPLSLSPVEFNDLFFPAHAALCCYIMVVQAYFYEVSSKYPRRKKNNIIKLISIISEGKANSLKYL